MQDFAKIMRASNGQQVLFWFEPDTEDEDEGTKMHIMVHFDDWVVDMTITFKEQDDAQKYLEGVGQATADAGIRMIKEMRGDM